MSQTPTLIVTVLYNSALVLDTWLDGIRKLRETSAFPIVTSVVDNASRDTTVRDLRRAIAQDEGIFLTASETNAGWGAGNNLGINAAAERGPFAATVFLNPDVILDPAAHDLMRYALADDPTTAAVIPRLRDGEGNVRIPAFPEYTVTDTLLGTLGWRGFQSARWQKPRSAGTIHDLNGGFPEGSCVMVRNTALQKAGPFDEAFFMYFDDMDLGRRLAADGGHLRFLPEAVATDLPGKGSRVHEDRAESRLDRYVFFLASELRYHAKWRGPRTARWLARFKLWFDLPLRTILWRLLLGVRGTSAKCRPIVKAFLRKERTGS